MAETTQKKSGSTSRKRSTAPKTPQKRPIRREVGGGVCLLLGLCTIYSYFADEGIVIVWLARVLKCLLGWGYYFCGAALILAGVILLAHHGRPVRLRVTCALLLPLLLGALCHMLATNAADYPSDIAILKTLWNEGAAVTFTNLRGGVLSGTLAIGFVKLFSKTASIIIFTALFVALLMVALRLTLGALIEKHKNRPQYEEEPEEPKAEKEKKPVAAAAIPAAAKRPNMDIPLDDEPAAPAPPKNGKRTGITGFFRHKDDAQKTPAEVLDEDAPAIEDEADPFAAEKPPVSAPVPVAPAPAAPAASKKAAAKEVEQETAAVTAEIEETLAAEEPAYQFPPITLLRENGGGNAAEASTELRNNSNRLMKTLESFNIEATAGDVIHGPSVTRYEFTLADGVKIARVTSLADDIASRLGADRVRIAPVPDKISVVGIEVPNKAVASVLIRDVIESREFTEHPSKVAFAIGRDIGGKNIIGDVEKLPHVLVAGTTGSGKSVCMNSLIVSLLYKSTPEEVRFIMVDPKMVELAPYNGIPHLLIPVVTDAKKAAGALQWAVVEMMKRYKTFSEHGVKKLEEYNKVAAADEELEPLPRVVVVIDELADLMLAAAKEVEESICRVAQMGRAAGVHLVIATQRPSADVITGLMKANIPSRIAFAVASAMESRIILDAVGAEKLVGRGDMLYSPLGDAKPTRVQGCFISAEEIEDVVQFIKKGAEAKYSDEVIKSIDEFSQEKPKGGAAASAGAAESDAGDDGDELLPAAVDVILETGQASVSMLQRRLKLGYSRAARLVDQMEERGFVGPFEGSKPRQILITKEKWQELQMAGEADGAQESVPEEI